MSRDASKLINVATFANDSKNGAESYTFQEKKGTSTLIHILFSIIFFHF